METSGGGIGGGGEGTASIDSRRHGFRSSPWNYIQAPLTALLGHSGALRPPTIHPIGAVSSSSGGGGEVSIRIIGSGDQEIQREEMGAGSSPLSEMVVVSSREGDSGCSGGASVAASTAAMGPVTTGGDEGGEGFTGDAVSSAAAALLPSVFAVDASANDRDPSHQRLDIQQVARWIQRILPFSLLLLVVFIRQHLQGFFVSIWIAAVMFKSNDILRRQTDLKGERKHHVLAGIILVFIIHVFGVYWLYKNDDMIYPLVLLPPKEIPPFWHAVFIVLVNDTMVRQAAMVVKCVLLMHYKNSVGRNYRKQGQMLTLVEYLLLLYRALLPTPVWYRFFLNHDYGSLFSYLTTGLYLTFKLTLIVEKARSFITALMALSLKEVHYGSHATVEQVVAAGDLCAICQEKMQAPILLGCKHIFCEDCVTEWFERERTCPLCRALVKPVNLRSFGDGSTSLLFQFF